MRARDLVVYDRCEVKRDIVLGHTDLLRDLDDLDLDVNLDELLAQRVDLDETGVNGAIEAAKFGDEPDITLRHGLIWVGATDTARNGTKSANEGAQAVDHRTIPPIGTRVAFAGERLRVARLEVLSFWRCDVDERHINTRRCRWTVGVIIALGTIDWPRRGAVQRSIAIK